MIAVELGRVRLETGKAVKRPLLWQLEKLQEPEAIGGQEKGSRWWLKSYSELSRWLSA